jgi:hypothetical protein
MSTIPHRSGSATGRLPHTFPMHDGQHRQPFRTVEQHQVMTGRDVVVFDALFDAELPGGLGAVGFRIERSGFVGVFVFRPVSECPLVDSVSSGVSGNGDVRKCRSTIDSP